MKTETLDAIRAHAVAEYPRECCGVVLAAEGAELYVPCRNQAPTPGEHFQMAPEDYADAEDRGTVQWVVHSHPDAPETPSEADKVACEASGLPWLIVSVRGDDGRPAPVAGDFAQLTPNGYEAPYIGRPFFHGILDCWTLVRDWYRRERGLELPNPPRVDNWWNDGASDLYSPAAWAAAGFEPVGADPVEVGDVIAMQIRAKNLVANHVGLYLGGGLFMHHLHGRLSTRDVFGGYWRECTRMVYRYKGSV